MAGTDCGFGTVAGMDMVVPSASAREKDASVRCHLCVMPYRDGNTGQLA